MPKQNYKSLICSILLLFCLHSFYAQSNLEISYNDKILLRNVDSNSQFYFKDNLKEVHLKGKEINDYTFKNPGVYLIKVVEKKAKKKTDSCEEHHLPKEITVNVSRIKMSFNAANMSFSSPITKNIDTAGIILSIPVSIETYDHKPIQLNFSKVSTAGIGTTITANLESNVNELPGGNHILKYSLTGIVSENSYIMFDFVDANGKIQTISLLTAIKN